VTVYNVDPFIVCMGFRNATGFMSLYSKIVKYKLVKACM